jgi:hypothetical protein
MMTPLDLFLWLVCIIGGLGVGLTIFAASFASFGKISELIEAICQKLIDKIEGRYRGK